MVFTHILCYSLYRASKACVTVADQEHLISCYSDLDDAMKNVAVQILKEVNECLTSHGFKALDNDRAGMLQTQLEALSNTEHAVQKLMSKC